MFWFFFTIIVLLLAHYGDEKNSKGNNYVYARVCLTLTLAYAIGICGEGADRMSYANYYNVELDFFDFHDIIGWVAFDSQDMEIGFYLICKACKILGFSAMGMLFVVSILTNTLVVSVFYRFKYPVVIFALYIVSYYYLAQTNLVRQMLAVAIMLYSLKYLETKSIKKFIIGLFIAFLIHKSSLVYLFVLLFYFFAEKRRKTVQFVLMGLWLISLLAAVHMISLNFSMGSLLEDNRYQYYAENAEKLGHSQTALNWVYNFIVAFCFIYLKDLKEKSIYWAIVVIGAVISNISIETIYLRRVAAYFTPMFCAFAPMLQNKEYFNGNSNVNNWAKYLLYFAIFYYCRHILTFILRGNEQIGTQIRSILEIF